METLAIIFVIAFCLVFLSVIFQVGIVILIMLFIYNIYFSLLENISNTQQIRYVKYGEISNEVKNTIDKIIIEKSLGEQVKYDFLIDDYDQKMFLLEINKNIEFTVEFDDLSKSKYDIKCEETSYIFKIKSENIKCSYK